MVCRSSRHLLLLSAAGAYMFAADGHTDGYGIPRPVHQAALNLTCLAREEEAIVVSQFTIPRYYYLTWKKTKE